MANGQQGTGGSGQDSGGSGQSSSGNAQSGGTPLQPPSPPQADPRQQRRPLRPQVQDDDFDYMNRSGGGGIITRNN